MRISELPYAGSVTDSDYVLAVQNGQTVRATATAFKGDPGSDGSDGTSGVGVPPGGTAGQILAKNSDSDYDTEWVNQTGGGGTTGTIVTDGLQLCLDVTNTDCYSGSGTTLSDLSTNGFDVTVPDAAMINQLGIYFNGSQYIDTGHTATQFGIYDHPLSLSCMLTFTDTYADRFIFGTTTESGRVGLHVGARSYGWLHAFYGADVTGGQCVSGIPYHLCCTNDGSTGNIWVNGVLVASGAQASFLGYANILLGLGHGTDGYFKGLANHIQIYNKVLTHAEILQNFIANRSNYIS